MVVHSCLGPLGDSSSSNPPQERAELLLGQGVARLDLFSEHIMLRYVLLGRQFFENTIPQGHCGPFSSHCQPLGLHVS